MKSSNVHKLKSTRVIASLSRPGKTDRCGLRITMFSVGACITYLSVHKKTPLHLLNVLMIHKWNTIMCLQVAREPLDASAAASASTIDDAVYGFCSRMLSFLQTPGTGLTLTSSHTTSAVISLSWKLKWFLNEAPIVPWETQTHLQ